MFSFCENPRVLLESKGYLDTTLDPREIRTEGVDIRV